MEAPAQEGRKLQLLRPSSRRIPQAATGVSPKEVWAGWFLKGFQGLEPSPQPHHVCPTKEQGTSPHQGAQRQAQPPLPHPPCCSSGLTTGNPLFVGLSPEGRTCQASGETQRAGMVFAISLHPPLQDHRPARCVSRPHGPRPSPDPGVGGMEVWPRGSTSSQKPTLPCTDVSETGRAALLWFQSQKLLGCGESSP